MNSKEKSKETSANNTIFDDVFRTIAERMPKLMIPLINEVFHTQYSEDEEILSLHNEHQTKSGEVITDSCLLICERLYHIECQSNPDNVMPIRMIEYDFSVALENAVLKNGVYEMEFPKSCTLYLRDTKNTPDELKVRVLFGNETPENGERSSIMYTTPVVKVQKYSKEEIFQKKLLLFLPFYIMRYEKQFKKMQEDSDLLEDFLSEYREICTALEQECAEKEKSVLYTDLMELIIKISDYLLMSEEKIKERIDTIMGGQVLKLRSEELREEGFEKGRMEGRMVGREEGLQQAMQVLILYKKGEPIEAIAAKVGLSTETVQKLVRAWK